MAHSVTINALLVFCFVGVMPLSMAENQTLMNLKGKLLDMPPCEVYGDAGKGSPIKIEFGEVAIQRINGERYRQPLALTVACEGSLGNNVNVLLTYAGTAATDFDSSALLTSQKGLGIRLYQTAEGTVLAPNATRLLRLSSNDIQSLALSAVPVKSPVERLKDGVFTATATLSLTYP